MFLSLRSSNARMMRSADEHEKGGPGEDPEPA
jgi:hypothetical protein